MSEEPRRESVTDRDRERAAEAMEPHLPSDLPTAAWDYLIENVAAALTEERERERSTWNPMVGRVLAVAQEWERQGERYHSRQIFDAIEGRR